MRGFKAFLLRGNVVDLAIGVVIGIAFGLVITAFVKDLVTPLKTAPAGTQVMARGMLNKASRNFMLSAVKLTPAGKAK